MHFFISAPCSSKPFVCGLIWFFFSSVTLVRKRNSDDWRMAQPAWNVIKLLMLSALIWVCEFHSFRSFGLGMQIFQISNNLRDCAICCSLVFFFFLEIRLQHHTWLASDFWAFLSPSYYHVKIILNEWW